MFLIEMLCLEVGDDIGRSCWRSKVKLLPHDLWKKKRVAVKLYKHLILVCQLYRGSHLPQIVQLVVLKGLFKFRLGQNHSNSSFDGGSSIVTYYFPPWQEFHYQSQFLPGFQFFRQRCVLKWTCIRAVGRDLKIPESEKRIKEFR
jgi:hypothetical protein